MELKIGLVDADLLDNGTRHPNLTLMQIAGFLKEKGANYKLIYDTEEVLTCDVIYLSKVFTFTKEYQIFENLNESTRPIVKRGGTGYYADIKDDTLFLKKRIEDMSKLRKDIFLEGFDPRKQMPDYHLYDEYVNGLIEGGANARRFVDYQKFSIGFMTRGCFRQCEFCVNRKEKKIYKYSSINDFMDETRPMIYLWDDNILGSKNWEEIFLALKNTNKPFQFRQGMDIRLITENKAKLITSCKYHGDYIFAFDHWKDRDLIIRKLQIWKKYAKKTTKLYLFCGYEITEKNEDLYNDVIILFKRIEILMQYGCNGYVMRHVDYKNHPLNNIYVQIARWCNQPQFYKKTSFYEFIERNQMYVKGNSTCKAKRTFEEFMETFKEKKEELDYYFKKMKYENTINPKLWGK